MATSLRRPGLRLGELVVLALAVLAFGGMAIGGQLSSGEDAGRPEPPSLDMGEWIELNNQTVLDELRRGDTDSGTTDDDYRPLGEWDGTLRFRLDNVALYDSFEAAGIPADEAQLPSYLSVWDQEGYSLCLLTCTVENIDASPLPGSTKSGREGFSASFLYSLEGVESFDQIYFDGMIEDGSLEDGDGNVFCLEPGEAKTFHVGIVVVGDGAPSVLQIGSPDCGIKVALECEDKRSRS